MKISVVIPCFPPHIKYINTCINSLNKQTYKPDEIIIALSQTTEEHSINIYNNLKSDMHIKILSTKEKQYAGQNRNRGAIEAIYDIISFIDVDDEIHPQKLEIVKYIFETYKPKMFIHSYIWKSSKFEKYDYDSIKIYESDDIFSATFIDKIRNKENEYNINGQASAGAKIKIKNYTNDDIHHGHVSIDRNIVDEVKYEDIISGQDAIFCRDVLWKYNNTIFSPMKLVNFKFDSKNCKNKCKWYGLDYDNIYK